jgi:hypothetical protein
VTRYGTARRAIVVVMLITEVVLELYGYGCYERIMGVCYDKSVKKDSVMVQLVYDIY